MDNNRDSKGRFVRGHSIGHRFQPGNSSSPGRPPRPSTVLKNLPKDARDQVYNVLWTAISLNNIEEAKSYIEDQAKELPACGMVLQVCLCALLSKNGFLALMDICDRLFGKPYQAHKVDMDANVQGVTVNVTNPETKQILQEILDKDKQQ